MTTPWSICKDTHCQTKYNNPTNDFLSNGYNTILDSVPHQMYLHPAPPYYKLCIAFWSPWHQVTSSAGRFQHDFDLGSTISMSVQSTSLLNAIQHPMNREIHVNTSETFRAFQQYGLTNESSPMAVPATVKRRKRMKRRIGVWGDAHWGRFLHKVFLRC